MVLQPCPHHTQPGWSKGCRAEALAIYALLPSPKSSLRVLGSRWSALPRPRCIAPRHSLHWARSTQQRRGEERRGKELSFRHQTFSKQSCSRTRVQRKLALPLSRIAIFGLGEHNMPTYELQACEDSPAFCSERWPAAGEGSGGAWLETPQGLPSSALDLSPEFGASFGVRWAL